MNAFHSFSRGQISQASNLYHAPLSLVANKIIAYTYGPKVEHDVITGERIVIAFICEYILI